MNGSASDDAGGKRSGRVYPMMVARGWRLSLALLGVRRENAYARLDGDEVDVRVGRYFRARIPVSGISLARAGTGRRMCHFGVCVRQAEGLALVASSQGVVEIALSQPIEAWLLGRPVRFANLAISLEEAQDFLGEIHQRRQTLAGKVTRAN